MGPLLPFLLAVVFCDLIIRPQDYPKVIRFPSFGVFSTNSPVNPDRHLLLIPNIDSATCEFNITALSTYAGDGSPVALLVVPTPPCLSYAFPVRDLPAVKEKLKGRSYPDIDVVGWVTLPGELQPPGNPNSDMMLPDFSRDANVSYHVVDDSFARFLSTNNHTLEGYVTDTKCPWFSLLGSNTVNVVRVVFDFVKSLLMGAQVFLLLLSFLKSRSSGYIPFLLLVVGFLQISGDLIISRFHLFGMAANVYIMALLLAACVVNSLVMIAWYRILRLLNLTRVHFSPVCCCDPGKLYPVYITGHPACPRHPAEPPLGHPQGLLPLPQDPDTGADHPLPHNNQGMGIHQDPPLLTAAWPNAPLDHHHLLHPHRLHRPGRFLQPAVPPVHHPHPLPHL
ncbi:hypothetical protein DSO57_1008143 [Entomophthora muscae]|uniref:Uncharacterized protein n=1 Tax=Entomophthora muscae TaxID=34485 RepID=A0ACC2SJX6_9FUNG|nr:hypothetical protein DSO57_1008143 [Entomophthora muscae]